MSITGRTMIILVHYDSPENIRFVSAICCILDDFD